jgi:hypothetical protein
MGMSRIALAATSVDLAGVWCKSLEHGWRNPAGERLLT